VASLIKKLSERDHEVVFPFLKREPSFNLFMIGDIEVYGYETDFQELWGDFDEAGVLRGVLLRYYEHFVVSGLGYDRAGFLTIMRGYPVQGVSGSRGSLLDFEEDLKGFGLVVRDTYFAECKCPVLFDSNVEVKLADVADAWRIAVLESQLEEFSEQISLVDYAEQIVKRFEAGAGRTYYVEVEGEMVSLVSSTAENSLSAMIVGVATLPAFRKRGYVSAILSRMLGDLLAEKESVCLFYDNPKAGAIYKRIGFEDIGMWRMYVKGDA